MNVRSSGNAMLVTVALFTATICQAQYLPSAESQPIGSGVLAQSLQSDYSEPPERSLERKGPAIEATPIEWDFPSIPQLSSIGTTCDTGFELLEGYGLAEESATMEGENDVSRQEENEEGAGGEDDALPLTLLGPRWHNLGPIGATCIYTSQVFNNSRGGISTNGATRYRGNLDVTLTLDTEAANWWKGGQFMVYMQQSHGQTLTQDFVGDAQFYSNIDTSPKGQDLTQLGEYWYEHRFAEDGLSLRIGRQDANADFAYADLGGDFVNSSFLTLANIPMPTWPFQAVGVSSLFQVNDKLRLGGGAYDQGRDIGQWWATSTDRGMFFIGQADYQPFADIADTPLTIVRFGSWYTNSDTLAVDGSTDFDNNFGFYTTIDRMLFSESADAEQGLGTFLQYAWAPQDRNQIDVTYGSGLVYRGLLPNRDIDTLGMGFTVVEISSVLRAATGQTSENAIELFYKARLNDWLYIQPDMQYIVRPSGVERDALVFGLQAEVIL